MTLPIGSAGRQARLRGVAQTLRRFLAECEDSCEKVWRAGEEIDADRTLLTGEYGVIEQHQSWDVVDDAWFDMWVDETGESNVKMVGLTSEGERANQNENYGVSGGVKEFAVATDGGRQMSSENNR